MAFLSSRQTLSQWFSGLCMVLLLLVGGCEKKPVKKTAPFTVVTAQAKSTTTDLHFKGTLAPFSAQPVLSPIDGRITHILFQYGQSVQQGQPLITLDAGKLAEDYRKTVSDFLEKKQNYETGKISFQGTQALYKAGVISEEEYLTAASRQRSDILSYFQAKYELEKLLPQTSFSIAKIEQLNLADMTQVSEILYQQFQEIKIFSPAQGVALFPAPDEKKDNQNRLRVGDDIKTGQLILSIGDLSGFSLKVNVSEISVNLIKPNISAKITGDAFPGIVLPGYVAAVAAQANPQSGDSGLGMFEVVIKVPKITPQQQAIIRVGMSATVELNIPEPAQIYLPIRAVHQTNGQDMVTILTTSGGQKEVPVITGKTTLTEVAIVQGISAGDRVVVPH